jgi:hypothetical protein
MSSLLYHIRHALSCVVADVPLGTNLGLFHLLWTLLSGRWLQSRGAVIPALADFGLGAAAVRRAWAALAYGCWSIAPLLAAWQRVVQDDSQWQAHRHGGYRPVACDLVGFGRPRLHGCPTKHYCAQAGKALLAIPLGLTARVGSVGSQRLAIPLRRLYWNCRVFREGKRKGQSPYALLGLHLPKSNWWQLLQMAPEELEQQLLTQYVGA